MAVGALGRDPGVQVDGPRKVKGPKAKGGALAVDPKGFQVAPEGAARDTQAARLQAIIDKKGGAANAPKAAKRLAEIQAAGGNVITTPGAPSTGEAPATFESVTQQGNEALTNTFEQMNNQGAFNPGDYTQMRQQAEDSVMNSFNQRMNPQFQQQDERFRQQMANQGIPENSEMYQQQYQQMMQGQNDARQGAMSQAFQLGQGEQAQGWNQAFQGYQLPMAQLNALSPYYGAQAQQNMQTGQQEFAANQADLDRQFGKWQQKYNRGTAWGAPRGGGGGGGGLSFEQQKALQDSRQQGDFFNSMVMNGLQNGEEMPGQFGNSFAGGFAGGSANQLGGNLRK